VKLKIRYSECYSQIDFIDFLLVDSLVCLDGDIFLKGLSVGLSQGASSRRE